MCVLSVQGFVPVFSHCWLWGEGQGTVSLFHMETQLLPLTAQRSAFMFKQGENRLRKWTFPSMFRLKLLWARSEKRKGREHGHVFLWYSTSYMIFASCHFIQQRPLPWKSCCYSNTCCKTVLWLKLESGIWNVLHARIKTLCLKL